MTPKNPTDNNINPQNQQGSSIQNNPSHQPVQNTEVDERDEKIKQEPDTRRLRSERQSVIDGEQDNDRS